MKAADTKDKKIDLVLAQEAIPIERIKNANSLAEFLEIVKSERSTCVERGKRFTCYALISKNAQSESKYLRLNPNITPTSFEVTVQVMGKIQSQGSRSTRIDRPPFTTQLIPAKNGEIIVIISVYLDPVYRDEIRLLISLVPSQPKILVKTNNILDKAKDLRKQLNLICNQRPFIAERGIQQTLSLSVIETVIVQTNLITHQLGVYVVVNISNAQGDVLLHDITLSCTRTEKNAQETQLTKEGVDVSLTPLRRFFKLENLGSKLPILLSPMEIQSMVYIIRPIASSSAAKAKEPIGVDIYATVLWTRGPEEHKTPLETRAHVGKLNL